MTTQGWIDFIVKHIPPGDILRHDLKVPFLIIQMLDVDQKLGGRVQPTSWYRSIAKNAEVGGHPESQHLAGLALDIKGVTAAHVTPLLLFGQAVQESDHVHIQAYPAGARASVIRSLRR